MGAVTKFITVRSIPTPVGNATVWMIRFFVMAVHPHACGERLAGGRVVPDQDGPSPRLWGTHADSVLPVLLIRSIPTPVGNAR